GIKDYLDLQPTFGTFAELEAHLRLIHAPFGPLTDAQWQALARSSARHDPDGWRLRYDPAIRFAYAELAEDDVELWSLWDAIRAPTFVLRGADSIVLPADVAEAMRTRGPKAVVETVVGVGHAPALMDPQQVETVAGWLDLAG
ncbi:MAG: alpha/beta fold hydrolase, partial [Pseudomonadota bacterium]